MSEFLLILTAVTGCTAAGAAIWLGFINRRQVQESVEAQRAAQVPVLIPHSAVSSTFPSEGPYLRYDANATQMMFDLRNVGPGPAFNVRGILYCAEPEQPSHTIGPVHSLAPVMPIGPQESIKAVFTQGGSMLPGTQRHGDRNPLPLYAPRAPIGFHQTMREFTHVARLTLNYDDIFGRTHRAVFDLLMPAYNWVFIASEVGIKRDLESLERAVLDQIPLGLDGSLEEAEVEANRQAQGLL